jgi:hypothetical protein
VNLFGQSVKMILGTLGATEHLLKLLVVPRALTHSEVLDINWRVGAVRFLQLIEALGYDPQYMAASVL